MKNRRIPSLAEGRKSVSKLLYFDPESLQYCSLIDSYVSDTLSNFPGSGFVGGGGVSAYTLISYIARYKMVPFAAVKPAARGGEGGE